MHRKRKKNDLSTRRLSFNTSIPDSPNKSVKRKEKTPVGRKTNSTKNKKTRSPGKSQRKSNVSTILEESDFEIRDLLRKRWKIYRVSPFYNFQDSKLKIYGKKLCEELCSISNKFDYDTSFSSLSASFSVADGFNPSVDDSYALQVKVTTNNNRNNYIGYFISWASKAQDENFTTLPILLAAGSKQMQNLVHQSICKFFDCDIIPMQLSLRVLVIHLAKYLETVQGEAEETALLSLQYRLPGFNHKNSITVTLSVLDTVAVFLYLLNQIEDGGNGNYVRMQLYERELYKKLLFHILQVYQLDLTHGDLYKVVFPQAILTSDGEIKWTNTEMAALGLSVLKEFISLD